MVLDFNQRVDIMENAIQALIEAGNTPEDILAVMNFDYDKAAEEVRTAAEIEPDNAIFHYCLGNALALKRDFDGAREELERALELNPEFDEAREVLELIKEK